MGQVGSYYNPAAAAYGSLSAASMAAAAAAAAAQQSAISGLSAPAQVKVRYFCIVAEETELTKQVFFTTKLVNSQVFKNYFIIKVAPSPFN